MVTLYAEGDFLISRDEGIVTATFNRAQTRNALTFDMYERLSRLCLEAAEDPSLKAIILTGAGDKAFAAGTDIAQFRAFTSGSDGIDYEQRIEAVLEPVEKCPVPLIAAIAGACTGGGAAIAACCDLRVATADMRFGFPIARSLGNTLSMGNFRRLVDLLGPARVKHMIFTAELMQAQEAMALGFLSAVVPNADALMPRARALAEQLCGHAPLTMMACKEALRRLRIDGPDAIDHDLVMKIYASADFKEGIDAFLGKRAAQWTGR
ncbi:MAG: enoyl-CoA hydratase [Betaproteobacteria bacterium]|nr:enoyl-CoA hydratase/isomerase family protein [Pseudomonadota bacterium]NCZ98344.1 enoyl-CoA hydratase [Betaproteobacteria bacterium]NDG59354.1 enoyl-CoA hydratase [Betaproteobacteria bacterium]NDH56649.1 enoyl-CoA hydratase [Betaproteobacteria bacterium]